MDYLISPRAVIEVCLFLDNLLVQLRPARKASTSCTFMVTTGSDLISIDLSVGCELNPSFSKVIQKK